jgi:hypothetical protein
VPAPGGTTGGGLAVGDDVIDVATAVSSGREATGAGTGGRSIADAATVAIVDAIAAGELRGTPDVPSDSRGPSRTLGLFGGRLGGRLIPALAREVTFEVVTPDVAGRLD